MSSQLNFDSEQKEILYCFYIAWTQFHFELTIEELEDIEKLNRISSKKNKFGFLNKRFKNLFFLKKKKRSLSLEEIDKINNILKIILAGNSEEIFELAEVATNSINLHKLYEEAGIIIHEKQKGKTRYVSEKSIYGDNYLSIIIALERMLYEKNQNTLQYENHQSWQPTTYKEWLVKDKLAQQLLKNGVKDRKTFDASAIGFFDGWCRMPNDLKLKVWREREIMGALCERVNVWQEIPGFISVGVAQRMINGNRELAGILNFQSSNVQKEQLYQRFNIPKSLQVPSIIKSIEFEYQETIPILLEWYEPINEYNSENINIYTSETSSKSPQKKKGTPSIQSGDIIVGCNQGGRFNLDSKVTLSTCVYNQDSSGKLFQQALSVNHGFMAGYNEAYNVETSSSFKIGHLSYRPGLQEEKAKNLDVALFEMGKRIFEINPYLKWEKEIPELPIPVYSGMPVEMYGGSSKHQKGFIDMSYNVHPGSASSVIPYFTVDIKSAPGDSGALLVCSKSDRGLISTYTNEKYLSMVYPMLGILKGGGKQGRRNLAFFIPMLDIFSQLKLDCINASNYQNKQKSSSL